MGLYVTGNLLYRVCFGKGYGWINNGIFVNDNDDFVTNDCNVVILKANMEGDIICIGLKILFGRGQI